MTGDIDAAYALCEQITREQARNFSWGIRLLPATKRRALSAVYAVARRIDDIGDGDLPPDQKLRELAIARAGSTAPGEHLDDPVFRALDDAARHLPIPLDAFGELVDGCEMDVTGRSYDDLDQLVEYCRCVAGSIGRLSLGVFDPRPGGAGAAELADALGVALQLTNILRDIREDLLNGRVYLPQEDLDRFGVDLRIDDGGVLVDDAGALTALVRFSADRARTWYDDGLRLVPMLDRRSAACCAAMSGIYRRLLDRIAADPALIRDRRLSLSAWAKTGVALRSLAGSAR
jgi:15-cis-phytoene synthase